MKHRITFGFFLLAAALLAAWLGGLVIFVTNVSHLNEPVINNDMPSTQAIVVLTGGSERLSIGLELLAAGKGKKLFVSGVYPGLTLNQLLTKEPIPENLRKCCIVLGHNADNTIGNAEETRTWMKEEKYKSLRLVTSHYHMPRSLLIFHEMLPDFEIIPHPVTPDSVKFDDWWLRQGTGSLMICEYHKFLFEVIREQMEKFK